MKSRINIILPIVLAVALPGLSLLTVSRMVVAELLGFFEAWLTISVLLYLLWYVLWYLWDLKTGNNKWRFIATAMTFLAMLSGLIFLVTFRNMDNFQAYNSIRILLAVIVFVPIQYALKTQQNISRLQLEKEQIQTENYKAQLKALRAQIDPHFLFNSLNTLRSMVRHGHSNAEKFIINLSDFYRQTLKHNENTTLPLSQELAVLESYLFLMKSRNEEAMSIHMDIDPALHPFHLPTLALQVVVENCFKHNSMTSKMPLHIEIVHTDDYYIEVRNNIQPRIGNGETSGYGLELLRKRYELMNIQDGVLVEQTAGQFRVKLKLV